MADRQRPGITLRDARLAILIEDTFSRHFLASGYALLEKNTTRLENETPQSITAINKATYTSKESKRNGSTANTSGELTPAIRRSCRICGGQHDALWCLERYTKLPPAGKPCKYCKKEGHWSMNCPLPSQQKHQQPAPPKTRLFRTPRKCPVCKGDHWASDCKQSTIQAPLLSLYKA
jgi:hypothetical protein